LAAIENIGGHLDASTSVDQFGVFVPFLKIPEFLINGTGNLGNLYIKFLQYTMNLEFINTVS